MISATMEDTNPTIEGEKSLETMVTELHQAHVSQIDKIQTLSDTVLKLEDSVQGADRDLKKALKNLSTLNGEHIWFCKEIQSVECECEERLKDIDRFVDEKLDEEDKLRKIKHSVEQLERKEALVERTLRTHNSKIEEHVARYVDKDTAHSTQQHLQEARSKRESLRALILQSEEEFAARSEEFVSLEQEVAGLHKQEEDLQVQISEKNKNVTETYESQVDALNKRAAQLQSAHNSHKSQLRDLNRVISTNSYRQ